MSVRPSEQTRPQDYQPTTRNTRTIIITAGVRRGLASSRALYRAVVVGCVPHRRFGDARHVVTAARSGAVRSCRSATWTVDLVGSGL